MNDRMTAMDRFLADAGWAQARRDLLAGDASNRRYDRLILDDGRTAVLMDAPADKGEDVRPFVRIADWLRAQGASAPEIYAQDAGNGFLLIEDLGDDLFARLMVQSPAMTRQLYTAATDCLLDLHKAPPPDLPLCDADWLTEAAQMVFDWYAPDSGAAAEFNALFTPLARALDNSPRVIILRDYHAENLLWRPERTGSARVGLLDFQDALQGHPAYDLVSILQDARRDVTPQIETAMIAHYIRQSGQDDAAFRSAYALLGLQRNLRILGIFARLCLRDGKAHYVDFIPRVWGYVQRNLDDPALAPLADVLRPALPAPTPEFLKDLKARCATPQMP